MVEKAPQIPVFISTSSESGDLAQLEEAAFAAGVADVNLPVKPPRIPPLSAGEQQAATSEDNGQAKAEEKSLSANKTPEELADIARNREADREQRFKDAFEHLAIQALYLGTWITGILAFVWALHLVLPKDKRWLDTEELTHLQTLLTAGVLVGAVGGHFKKRMGESELRKS